MGHALHGRCRTCVQVGGNPCQDDDCHRDRYRNSRLHRVPDGGGDLDAANTGQGTPDLTARHQTSRPEVQATPFCICAVLSMQASTIYQEMNDGSDSHGHAAHSLSGGCTIWRLPRSLIGKAGVMETLLCGCVTWTLGKERFAEPRMTHHRFLLRIIGFLRPQRTDHFMSCAKALKKAQCESVETIIRKRRLLFAGAVQWTNIERPTRRGMVGTMAGEENPGPGRSEKNLAQCLLDDLRVVRATEDPRNVALWCSE